MMLDPQQIADRYAAVWNEPDAAARRRAIEEIWQLDGRHFVRVLEARGHDALERRVSDSHMKNVRDGGFRFRARRDAQRLRDTIAFHWEMFRPDTDDVVATGLEFIHLDEAGRIRADYQFIVG